MKFRVQRAQLYPYITAVTKAVSSRSPLEILKGVLLEVKEHQLTLTGSDGEVTIVTSVEVYGEEDGSVVIDGNILKNVIRHLPNAAINFSLEGSALVIVCEDAKFQLSTSSAKEYPSLPHFEVQESFSVPRVVLEEGIHHTIGSVSKDEMRLALTGILWDIAPDSISFVSLDGFRMAMHRYPVNAGFAREAIVPSRSAQLLTQLMNDMVETVAISISDQHMRLEFSDLTLYTKLIQGPFFSYEDLRRTDHEITVRVKREELVQCLLRTGLLSTQDRSNLVRLDVTSHQVVLSSKSEIGKVRELLEATVEGYVSEEEPFVIAFNNRYLLDGVDAIASEEVLLQFTNKISPCIIEEADESKDYFYLVLPVRTPF